jgi:tetratricopeptide (TPR) repeat protein
MDYTAVGQTTHLAARMEQLARPGTTLLTADTLRLVEGYVEITPLGPVSVKGLPELVEVYELWRAGPVRSRLQAAVARGLTRFVGRDTELEHLRQALARAGAGHGQVVAGVGAVYAEANPPDSEAAEAYYRQALSLANELGMRPRLAHCHFGLGTLYAKIGHQEQARADLSIAIELYKAMDMTFWLPQAEAALAQVEGR